MRGGWDIDIRSLGILCDTGWDTINEVTDVTKSFTGMDVQTTLG